MSFRNTITATVALAALAIPAPALASTKSEKAQNKTIKKLQHDVKVLSGRIKDTSALLDTFLGCLYTYDLTWYGNVNGTNTDGYAYTGTDGSTLFVDAMAPTATGDVPVSFLVFGCTDARVKTRSFNKPNLFLPVEIGSPTRRHGE